MPGWEEDYLIKMTNTGTLISDYWLKNWLCQAIHDGNERFTAYISRKARSSHLNAQIEYLNNVANVPRGALGPYHYVYLCVANIKQTTEHLQPEDFVIKVGESYYVDQRLGTLPDCFQLLGDLNFRTWDLSLVIEKRILYDDNYGKNIPKKIAKVLVGEPRTDCKAVSPDNYDAIATILNRFCDINPFPHYDEPGGPAEVLRLQ